MFLLWFAWGCGFTYLLAQLGMRSPDGFQRQWVTVYNSDVRWWQESLRCFTLQIKLIDCPGMSSLPNLRNSLPRKGKHWSYNVLECVIQRGPRNGNFNLHIVGGAENGEFICIGDVKQEKLRYRRGKILPGDVVLEINGTAVAGYTQFDVLPLIKSSREAVTLRTVKPGTIKCLRWLS